MPKTLEQVADEYSDKYPKGHLGVLREALFKTPEAQRVLAEIEEARASTKDAIIIVIAPHSAGKSHLLEEYYRHSSGRGDFRCYDTRPPEAPKKGKTILNMAETWRRRDPIEQWVLNEEVTQAIEAGYKILGEGHIDLLMSEERDFSRFPTGIVPIEYPFLSDTSISAVLDEVFDLEAIDNDETTKIVAGMPKVIDQIGSTFSTHKRLDPNRIHQPIRGKLILDALNTYWGVYQNFLTTDPYAIYLATLGFHGSMKPEQFSSNDDVELFTRMGLIRSRIDGEIELRSPLWRGLFKKAVENRRITDAYIGKDPGIRLMNLPLRYGEYLEFGKFAVAGLNHT